MQGAPELVIPVRMDLDKALAQLQKIGDQGKKAGDDVDKGFKQGKQGADGFLNSVTGIMQAQIGLSTAKQVAYAIGQEYANAARHVTDMARQFDALRQAMQQVAALKGAQNNDQFALGEVRKAAAASLTPQAWTQFQEMFQSYGGAYVEGDQSRFKGQAGMTPEQQAEAYQQHIAKFAQARGISANEAAQLGGGLLQFSSGPQKVEDLEARFGKVFKTLERAPTPVTQLLPQMSRIMAQGASPEDAAKMLAIMSEAMPGEEETGVSNALKAITNQTLEGKGEALGQKEGMTPLEKIKAAVTAIRDRVGRGENLDRILHEVAPDLRETKGLRGFLTRGLEAGGFDRVDQYQQETPNDFVKTALTDYDKSDAGERAAATADRALAEAEQGEMDQKSLLERDKARTEIIRSGYDKETHVLRNAAGSALSTLVGTGVSNEDQVVNQQALANVRKRALAAGVKDSGLDAASLAGNDAMLIDQLSVNKEIVRLLSLIEAQGGAQKPLVAPPPDPNNRMGN